MYHGEVWRIEALRHLVDHGRALDVRVRGTFARCFKRAAARRESGRDATPMGTVGASLSGHRWDGQETLCDIWRAIDAGLRVADARFGPSPPRSPIPDPADHGGHLVIRAMVPHGSDPDARDAVIRSPVSSMQDIVVPVIDPSEAPVACRFLPPSGVWFDVRRGHGDYLRPVFAPETWTPMGIDAFAVAASGRVPWNDSPFAPFDPRHTATLPVEALAPVAPLSDPARRQAHAAAAQAAANLALCVIDGVVHVGAPLPDLVMGFVAGSDGSAVPVMTWAMGKLTGLTDMRTQAIDRLRLAPVTEAFLRSPDMVPHGDLRGLRRYIGIDGAARFPADLSRLFHPGTCGTIDPADFVDVVAPDLMPLGHDLPGLRSVDDFLSELSIHVRDGASPQVMAGFEKVDALRRPVMLLLDAIDGGDATPDLDAMFDAAADAMASLDDALAGLGPDRLGPLLGAVVRDAAEEARNRLAHDANIAAFNP